MSDSVPSSSSVIASPFEGPHNYALSSDLAKLCLPATFKDSYRKLAWANSICALFLTIGLIGFKRVVVIVRPLVKPPEAMEVYLPPPEQPKQQPQVTQEEPEPQDQPVETPQVAVVAAVADPATVAFAVPVEGAVAVKNARYATPPPPVTWSPPKTKVFVHGQEAGSFPEPRLNDFQKLGIADQVNDAIRQGGTNWLTVSVDASGAPAKVEVKSTCGVPAIDHFDQQWVKSKWRWLPGEPREFLVPFVFRSQ